MGKIMKLYTMHEIYFQFIYKHNQIVGKCCCMKFSQSVVNFNSTEHIVRELTKLLK